MDNVLNIESNQFNPQKYVTNFLSKNSIQHLIRKNNEIQVEIKNYDQEIQSLVFENYSKFISSIDTVKKMKNDIFKVDEKMKILEQSMSKINLLANKIDDSLHTKREEIQKLETVNKDLQKLNSLCEFPIVLENDLKEYKNMVGGGNIDYSQIFNKSVAQYEICFQMLDEFKNEPLVKPIYKDSIDKVEEVRSILWNLQNLNKNQPQQIQDLLKNVQIKSSISPLEMKYLTKKLIMITEDKESVLRNYLKIIKDKFNKQAIDIMQNITEFNCSSHEQTIHFLHEKDYDVSITQLESFKNNLEKQNIKNDMQQKGSILWLVGQLQQYLFSELKEEIDFLLSDMEVIIRKNQKCVDAMNTTIKEIVMGLLQQVAERINTIKITNVQVNECFKNLYTNIQNSITNNKLIKKQLKTEVIDKFMENVELICRGQVNNSFMNLRIEFIDLLIDIKSNCKLLILEHYSRVDSETDFQEVETIIKKEVFNFLTQLKNKLQCLILNTTLDLKSFIFSEDQYLRGQTIFLGLLHNQVIEFLKIVFKLLITRNNKFSLETNQIINSAVIQQQQGQLLQKKLAISMERLKDSKESSAYFLVVNQFLQIAEKKFVGQVFENLDQINDKNIKILQANEPEIVDYYRQLKNQIQVQDIPRLIAGVRQDFIKNHINYSQFQAELMLKNLEEYFFIEQWKNMQDPRDISHQIELVAPQLKIILMELGILFPDMKRGLAKKGSFLKFESSFNIEMEKIIVKKAHHYTVSTESNRNIVLQNFIISLFKRVIERIRRLPLISKFGYQQIQIDFYFLIQIIYEMVSVDDEGIVTGLYFEISDSSQDVCQDPSKIDQIIVETISNSKRTKLKF